MRRLEQVLPDGWKKRDGKRARLVPEDEPQVVEDDGLGQIDLGAWIYAAEGICLRAGNLRSRLEKDGRRVARLMASLEQDKHLLDIGNLWKLEQEDTHLEEGLGARHPINKPNTTPRQMDSTATKTLPDFKPQANCVPEGGRGARHPVNKPISTPRQLEEQHQHADMPKPSFCGVASTGGGQKSDWSVHLTGLVGWWRRVESTQTKEDEKIRKFREKQQKLSVAKLSFVGKYFKTQTNPRTETTPNPVNKLTNARLDSAILSPAAKRKGGGVEYMAEFSSPNKRMRNFKSKLEYWETMKKSEGSVLAGPCDDSRFDKDGDKGPGGSEGGGRGYMK